MLDRCCLCQASDITELSWSERLVAQANEFRNALVEGPLFNAQPQSNDTASAVVTLVKLYGKRS